MRALFSITLEAVLADPGKFQVDLLQNIKNRYILESKDAHISEEKILKLMKTKRLLLQEDRLLFFWRFQQLCTLGALAFTDMNELDFARTLRLHWSKLDFFPVLSIKDISELLQWVELYKIGERQAYVHIYQNHRLEVEGIGKERALLWLIKKAIDESVGSLGSPTADLVMAARQYAALNYFDLTPGDLQFIGAGIAKEIDRFGLKRSEQVEIYGEITRMRIEFELWYQVVPDILKRKRARSQARAEILQLLSDKTVAEEIAYDARSANSPNCGLANFCLGLQDADRKKYDVALEKFTKAVKLGITNSVVLVEKAFCHYKLTEFLAAARILDSFDRRNVEESDRDFLLVVIENLPTDSHELAWNLARKYRLTAGIKIERLREFGEAFLNSGDLDTAQRIFEQILEIDAKDFDSYFFIAKICYRKNDVSGAKGWIDRLIQLEHRNFYSYYRAALLYADLGDRTSALQFLAHSFEMNPEFEDGLRLLLKLLKENRERLVEFLAVDIAFEESGILAAAIFNSIIEFMEDSGVVLPDLQQRDELRQTDQGILPMIMKTLNLFLGKLRELGMQTSKNESLTLLYDHLLVYSQAFTLLNTAYQHDKTGQLTLLTAEELYGQKNYRTAIALLKRSREMARDGWWWYVRGLNEFEIGHFSDAESTLREGRTRGEPRCLLFLGKIYALQKRIGEAAQALNIYLNDHHPDAGTQLALARAFIQIGDLKAAQNVIAPNLTDEQHLSPLLLSAMQFHYGVTLIRMGAKKRVAAEEYFRKSLLKVPRNQFEKLTSLAITIFHYSPRAEFLQTPIKLLTSALERQPSASLQFCIGKLYYESARKKEKKTHTRKGITHLELAVKDDPYHYLYLYYLGSLNQLQGESATAATTFKAVLEIYPQHFESLCELGMIEYEAKEDEQALVHLGKAAELDRSNSQVQFYLCRLYRKVNDNPKIIIHAIQGIDAAITQRDAKLRKDLSQELCEIFYEFSSTDDFAVLFLRLLADPYLHYRREIVTIFLRDLPSTAVRGETKTTQELALPLQAIIEKIQTHVGLLNNIPRDMKKTTLLSEQLMKRCLADIKDLAGKASEPVAQIMQIPVSQISRNQDADSNVPVPKEEWDELWPAIARIEIPKKNRRVIDKMIEDNLVGTYDYLLEFLKATHWPEKVMDIVVARILAGAKSSQLKLQFFKHLLDALAVRKQEGIDQRLHDRFQKLHQDVEAIKNWAVKLEEAWSQRSDIKEPLDALPQSILALSQDFVEANQDFSNL